MRKSIFTDRNLLILTPQNGPRTEIYQHYRMLPQGALQGAARMPG